MPITLLSEIRKCNGRFLSRIQLFYYKKHIKPFFKKKIILQLVKKEKFKTLQCTPLVLLLIAKLNCCIRHVIKQLLHFRLFQSKAENNFFVVIKTEITGRVEIKSLNRKHQQNLLRENKRPSLPDSSIEVILSENNAFCYLLV